MKHTGLLAFVSTFPSLRRSDALVARADGLRQLAVHEVPLRRRMRYGKQSEAYACKEIEGRHVAKEMVGSPMRLKVARAAAREKIIMLITEGYGLYYGLEQDYNQRQASQSFDAVSDNERYEKAMVSWMNENVQESLSAIFPTNLEWYTLCALQQLDMVMVGVDALYGRTRHKLSGYLSELQKILDSALDRYTDLPETPRLYIEGVDSFSAARDVNPEMVSPFLKGGFLDIAEDEVQIGIEQIITEPFHKKDWGGESSDLYSSQVQINGTRIATAFMLKGNGLRKNTMEIRDCGKNGDQILRLFTSPALLYVVQFVGNVSEAIIADVEGKVNEQRARGKKAHYLIMNGLDTARLLFAYGKLNAAKFLS
jgi:hypothetical protein